MSRSSQPACPAPEIDDACPLCCDISYTCTFAAGCLVFYEKNGRVWRRVPVPERPDEIEVHGREALIVMPGGTRHVVDGLTGIMLPVGPHQP